MPSENNVEIGVNVTANTAGAQQASDAIRGIGQNAQTAAGGLREVDTAGKSTSASLEKTAGHTASVGTEFVHSAHAAHGMEMAFTGASQGAGGLMQMLRGVAITVRSLGTGFGPVAAIGAAFSAASIGWELFRKKQEETKKETEEAAKKFDEARAAGEKFGALELKGLLASLKEVNTAVNTSIERLHETVAIEEEIATAADAATKAKIQQRMAEDSKYKAAGEAAIAEVDYAAKERTAGNKVFVAAEENARRQKALAEIQSRAEQPRAEVNAALAERNAAQDRQRQASTAGFEVDAARARFAELQKNQPGTTASSAERTKHEADLTQAYLDMIAAGKKQKAAAEAAPDAARMKELDDDLEKANRKWEAVNESLTAAKEAADKSKQRLEDRMKVDAATSTSASDEHRAEVAKHAAENKPELSPEEKAKAKAERDKQIAAMQAQGSELFRDRSASGGTVDADLYKDAFPGAAALPKSRYGATPGGPGGDLPDTPAGTPKGIYPAGTKLPGDGQASEHITVAMKDATKSADESGKGIKSAAAAAQAFAEAQAKANELATVGFSAIGTSSAMASQTVGLLLDAVDEALARLKAVEAEQKAQNQRAAALRSKASSG